MGKIYIVVEPITLYGAEGDVAFYPGDEVEVVEINPFDNIPRAVDSTGMKQWIDWSSLEEV